MKVLLRVLGIIAACVGIFFSINMMNTGTKMINDSKEVNLPDKYVYVSSSSYAYDYDWDKNTGAKYLGGDAYNYIVEASLKAGYYNATVTTKTAKEVGGNVIHALSIFSLFFSIFFLFFSLYSLMNCQHNTKNPQNVADKNNTERYTDERNIDESYADERNTYENNADESNTDESYTDEDGSEEKKLDENDSEENK